MIIAGTLKEFLYGTLCGDSNLEEKSASTARLTIQDNNNVEYMKWKVGKLSGFFNFREKVRENGLIAYRTDSMPELKELKKIFVNRTPIPMFELNSSMALAVWVMDDAHFHEKSKRYEIYFNRFMNDHTECEKIRLAARKKHLDFAINEKTGMIVFTQFSTDYLMQKIYRYVPSCMSYKLLPEYRNKYKDFSLTNEVLA